MTLTEYFAEKWLVECGYKDVEFRSWTTPDFIADDDYYEVKKLSGNSIVFSWGQFATLKKLKNVTILLYDCRYELIDTIPFSEFKESNNKCRGYNVIGTEIDEEYEHRKDDFNKILEHWKVKLLQEESLRGSML